MKLRSGLYEGVVTHQRWRPKAHQLQYRVYMVYTDLTELDAIAQQHWLWSVGRRNVAAFHRGDYFGDPQVPLQTAIHDLVENRTGIRPAGPVRMLTQWRTFGVGFSPVTFYYVFNHADDVEPIAIIPEVTNTPWQDRYQYVLTPKPLGGGIPSTDFVHGQWLFETEKQFHVSPFFPMDHHYRWYFDVPTDTVSMRLENYDQEGRIFLATLALKRHEVNRANLSRVLRQYPLMTWTVVWGIYWHAFQLWRKKIPFYPRPPGGTRS
jgi:DUF1365 family protein